MKITYLMELVAVSAASLAAVAAYLPAMSEYTAQPAPNWFRTALGAAWSGLPAAALAGGFGLLAESWRGRGPARWGVGRWIWAAAAIRCVLEAVQIHLVIPVVLMTDPDARMLFGFSTYRSELMGYLSEGGFQESLAWTVAVVAVTAALARNDVSFRRLDAREWSGVALAVALVVTEVLATACRIGLIGRLL